MEGATPPPYEVQLSRKECRVREWLQEFDIGEWKPILASPEAWQYRNKMEFAFGWDGPCHLVLGLRQAKQYGRVVDLDTCHLVSDEMSEILRRTRAWAKENNLRGYHRKRHEGDLRYLVLREGGTTRQRMAFLLSKGEVPRLEEWRKAIEPLASTAWHGVSQSQSDVARSEDMRLLWGPGYIEESVNAISYQISPHSFFQTNTAATEILYRRLAEWGRGKSGGLLDLYCGSGGITLAMAGSFDKVIGVDTNRGAIEDAKANAARNGLSNVEFVCEDAVEFLAKNPASQFAAPLTSLVVDPPRPGLNAKALEAIMEMKPPFVAYVSCNPESLARDLKVLAPLYRIAEVQPVDLFPNTPHVETLCFLERR